MDRRIARLLAVACTLVALLAPATVANAGTDASASASGRSTARVRMVDGNRFRPATLTIDRGDAVRWVNRDNVAHTTTSDSWNSGTMSPGETFRRRFRRAGTFAYRCTIHPTMRGTIVVG